MAIAIEMIADRPYLATDISSAAARGDKAGRAMNGPPRLMSDQRSVWDSPLYKRRKLLYLLEPMI